MTITKQAWQTIRNSTWIMLGLSSLVVVFILWILQFKHQQVDIIPVEDQAQQTVRPIQNESVGVRKDLGNFSQEVPALDLSQRVAGGEHHEPEFKGSKYINENNKRWTIQLLKVTEEDLIRAYLGKRQDRAQFSYLRLQDGKNPEQYVLVYGLYNNAQQAMNAAQGINFDLPDSVKVLPEKMTSYVGKVNDLGSDEISSGAALRTVVLTKAAMPKPQPVVPVTQNNDNAVTAGTTTVTTIKNDQGHVQDVKVEKSKVAPVQEPRKESNTPPATTKTNNSDVQVIDPF